jgi:hypothetical protein
MLLINRRNKVLRQQNGRDARDEVETEAFKRISRYFLNRGNSMQISPVLNYFVGQRGQSSSVQYTVMITRSLAV